MAPSHILDVQFPEVNPTGAPGGDYENIPSSPNMFGGITAKAFGELGQGLEKSADATLNTLTDINRLQDQTHASELHSDLSDKGLDIISGYRQLQGRAALDALPGVKQRLQDLQKDAESNAGNLYTKSLVSVAARRTLDWFMGSATNYADEQRTRWQTDTAKGNIDTATNMGGLAIGGMDFGRLDGQMETINREAHNYFDPKGYDPDTLASEVSKYKGSALRNWVETAATNEKDPDALTHAVQVYRRYEDDIDPASRLTISKWLNSKTYARSVDNLANYYVNGEVAGLKPSFVAGIKQSEGYREKPYWDVSRWSVGYGTKASGPDETADRFTLETRFEDEVTKAATFVDSVAPHLDPGTRAALTSLTYETGEKWASAGLGDAIKSGDLMKAQQLFLQYNQAGGKEDPAVMQRRLKEVQWFGKDAAPNVSRQDVSSILDRVRTDPLFTERPELQAAVEKNILAKTAMQARADAMAAKAQKEQSDAAELQIFGQIHSDKSTVTPDDIMNNPYMTREAKERMTEQLEKRTGSTKEEHNYGSGFYDLYKRVHLGETDPNRISDPSQLYDHVGSNGDLTVAGVDKLVTEIQGRKTPEGTAEAEMKKQFLANARAQITGTDEGLHIKDPKGDELYLKFLAQVLPKYQEQRNKGKSPAELLDPDSADYLGKAITTFKRPMDQWYADTINAQPEPENAPFDPAKVPSLDAAMADYRAGRITRDQARAAAQAHPGWGVTFAPPPSAPSVPISRAAPQAKQPQVQPAPPPSAPSVPISQ